MSKSDLDILYVLFTYGKEVEEWRKMSGQELKNKKYFLERISGSKILLKIHRVIHHVLFVIFSILFYVTVFYLSWLPVEKILNWLEGSPNLAFIFGGIVWCLFVGFIFWGLHAEDNKVLNKILVPIEKWDNYLKKREAALNKIDAINIVIKDIQNKS